MHAYFLTLLVAPGAGVHGMGFMAQDLTIQNTAGLEGLQAVALMSRSHFSLVYQCSIEGYQDTLNADTGDQIYLETDIRGTIDFVFGYARAVFIRLPATGLQLRYQQARRSQRGHRTGA